ncbi:hypothetical protein P154DRAFT_503447 [Amniculicola lignicola CBS 123094]|uniref:DUF3835 domain-containing protein n=1 Tax=Amniculicola lignicola CBS 123094 TaxID=1392246 RepID=A0A6A5W706_9PLEO|nr:hypothetical protein P154DRAFT_503447 [Amniculicola lignicola CBS 123094]
MANPDDQLIAGIERLRLNLEENVLRLQEAMDAWRAKEAAYTTARDELSSADAPTYNQVVETVRKLTTDEKALEQLVGSGIKPRTLDQVMQSLNKAIDYYKQSILNGEIEFETAEKKLAAAELLLGTEMANEDGEPLMEIVEELDDDDNVVASSVQQTGQGQAELVEALRKSGAIKAEKETSANKVETQLAATGYNEDLASFTFSRGTKVIELDDEENEVASYPIIPQDETPEAAELRRQMLQYGLTEVGQVVAEIDLDNPNDDWDEEMDDEEYDSDEDEEEDEYGRSTRPAITEEYRREMLELERRLNARVMENVGPRSEPDALTEHVDNLRTLVVRKDEDLPEATHATEPGPAQGSKKKGVRFAEKLDVSPAPELPQAQPESSAPKRPLVSTISDIAERSVTTAQATPASPSKPAKVSRFKNARASTTPPVKNQVEEKSDPQGLLGRPLSNRIVENPQSSVPYSAPDELDPVLLGREVQAEYHKQRNRMIQQQGGFGMTREEEEEGPLMENVDGKPKKVSRFRAAKLKAEDQQIHDI